MFASVLNTPMELLIIFVKGFILMFDFFQDTPLTCLKSQRQISNILQGVSSQGV